MPTDSSSRPYAPSWVDRLTAFVDRLPGPYWLWYLGVAAILFVVETIVQWFAGHIPFGVIFPFHVVAMGAPMYALALIHYLDRKAATAFDRFLPVLDTAKADPHRLRYRLTTMPARPVLAASAIGMFIAIANMLIQPDAVATLANVAYSGISLYFNFVIYIIVWAIFGALFFHTQHQLRGINLIYTQFTRVNLLKQYPLHALSTLTLHSALGLGVMFLSQFAEPLETRTSAFGFSVSGLFILSMIAIFFLPLLGVHKLLVEMKERTLTDCGERIEAVLARVREEFNDGKLEGVQGLSSTLSLLEAERNLLLKTATWPWQPDTLRGFIAAVLVPLFLWLLQTVLARLFAS